jgi:hypothetical protein
MGKRQISVEYDMYKGGNRSLKHLTIAVSMPFGVGLRRQRDNHHTAPDQALRTQQAALKVLIIYCVCVSLPHFTACFNVAMK